MLKQILEPWWLEAEENPISFPGSCLVIDRTTFCQWFGIWVISISKLRLCAYHSGFCGYSLQQQSVSCGLLWIYKNSIIAKFCLHFTTSCSSLFHDASCLWRVMVLGWFFSLKCHLGDSEIIPCLHCHVVIFSCVWSMWSPLTQISAGSMKHPSCLQTGWSQQSCLRFSESLC